MPTLEDGYLILKDTVANKKFHKNYTYVTELADKYKKLITGDKINTLLRKFVRREDDALFEQRCELTQAITPAVSSSLMNPFYKVGRSNSIIKDIDIAEDSDNKKLDDIKTAILQYNGEKSLDRYLETRFVDLNFTDPNSFIITEFDPAPIGPQGEMLEKVKPRPFECSSKNAINYTYKNNILQWLIVRLDIKYIEAKDTDNQKECDGYSYTIYLKDDAIKLTRVANDFVSVEKGNTVEYTIITTAGTITQKFYRPTDSELYLVEYFEHKSGKVPAKRVGYRLDLITDGETCVSPMHDAMCYFMKSIKTVSEFDLTMALHAFPQKFQYAPRCWGDETNNITCDSGLTPDGAKCSQCKGSGYMIHTSAQDAVMMRLPKTTDQIIDLQKLVHYQYPPIDLLKFQDEFIKSLKNEARQAVFNSEIFNRSQIASGATATEVKISLESVYDTLFPFAEAFSETYKYIVSLIANLRDVKDATVDHRFPKDFKFKTVPELLGELQVANTSNAPGYIKNQISMDIAEQQFVDKPEEFRKVKVKDKFYPFPDKNYTEIIYLISNNLTSEYNKVLWANFDNIFKELEQESEVNGKYFYDLAHKEQASAIERKVQGLIDDINSDAPALAVDFRTAASPDSSQPGQT